MLCVYFSVRHQSGKPLQQEGKRTEMAFFMQQISTEHGEGRLEKELLLGPLQTLLPKQSSSRI
jgi:hypothetical protein